MNVIYKITFLEWQNRCNNYLTKCKNNHNSECDNYLTKCKNNYNSECDNYLTTCKNNHNSENTKIICQSINLYEFNISK